MQATNLNPAKSADLEEILAGLTATPKTLSPRFFYDETGSELFDLICSLPEYYLTRTELGIMENRGSAMAQAIGRKAAVVEPGAGAALKTRVLLSLLEEPTAYVPVDISREFLEDSAASMAADFPDTPILPIAADFTQAFSLPDLPKDTESVVIYFPGSTIGNFPRAAAIELLRQFSELAGPEGYLLVGADLVKAPELLHAAYNDSREVTARFNLNVLEHLNREYEADFDLAGFRHEAVYDEDAERIEMRLISDTEQSVEIAGESIRFAAGEYIITEHSHKYTQASFTALAAEAGLDVITTWNDAAHLFSVQLLKPAA